MILHVSTSPKPIATMETPTALRVPLVAAQRTSPMTISLGSIGDKILCMKSVLSPVNYKMIRRSKQSKLQTSSLYKEVRERKISSIGNTIYGGDKRT